MIPDESRFFAPSADIIPYGPSTWHIVDADQRRFISVSYDEEQESEEYAIEDLKRHFDSFGYETYTIHVSEQGDLVFKYSSPLDDFTPSVHYPPLEDLQYDGAAIVYRSDLEELDRLGLDIDLAAYPALAQDQKQVIFKYYYVEESMDRIWNELNLWMRLPSHPNIVPFDKVVLEELAGRVVGFTTPFVPGGTLDENKSRVFKLKWLEQLIQVVDDLNLRYGIVHQDIAARKLLVNEETDSIMLFDFKAAARIGTETYAEHKNDLNGVVSAVFEIITRNDDFRGVLSEQQNPNIFAVEWVQHPETALDHPVSAYRSVLLEWLDRRRQGPQIKNYKDAPNYIDWPRVAQPNAKLFQLPGLNGETLYFTVVLPDEVRGVLHDKGEVVLKWDRPQQIHIREGDRLLANGKLIPSWRLNAA